MERRGTFVRNTESALTSVNAIEEFISSNTEETEKMLTICKSLKDSIIKEQCHERLLIFQTLASLIKLLRSREATQVIIGAMKIMPVLSALLVDPKTYGKFTNDVTLIATTFLSTVWKNEGVQNFLASESCIRCCSCWGASEENVLKCSRCFILKHKTEKTVEKMKICDTFLTTLQKQHGAGEFDLSMMMSTIGIDIGSSFLLILKKQIEEKITTQQASEAKHLLSLIQKYVVIAFLRGSFLLRLYSMFMLCSGDTGGGFLNFFTASTATTLPPTFHALKKVIEEDDSTVKSIINIFIDPPYRAAFLLAHFDSSSYPLIGEFAKSKGWEIQNLTQELNNKCFQLVPKSTPNIWTIMSSNPVGTIWGTFNPVDIASTLFTLSICTNNSNDNFFHIKSKKYSWYIIMGRKWSGARGTKDIPGEKGEWKIIKFHDGNFMMCTKQCLGKFIYMRDSGFREVYGHYGDLEECSHWSLTQPKEQYI